MERAILILLHVLGATVWVGGHLMLTLSVLPRALRQQDVPAIQRFEQAFERIGIPALLIQIATGLRLASMYAPPSRWLGFDDHISRHLSFKLIALACTLGLAAHARLSLVPRLRPGAPLRKLAWHIVLVTVLAVWFVLVGVSFRVGGML
jgi:putative copper export protein